MGHNVRLNRGSLTKGLISRAYIRMAPLVGNKKWVEAALNRSNAFLDSVIENIPHMIFVKEARELRFVRFNKAGEELLGYSKKDLIGKNDYDFFPKGEADFFTRKDREVLKSGKLFDIPQETIHTRKKGIRTIHTKKIPIFDEKGKPMFLLGISEDITDRLSLEKEIAATSDREQKRIGQDLHDGLGQLLTGVAFMSQVLSKRLEGQNLPEQKDARQIAKLVNQAISMTRNLARVLNPIELESGGLEVALAMLVSNTKKLFRISCTTSIPFPLQFSDNNGPIHIYRIIQEAIDNAVRHGRAKSIAIGFSKTKESLILRVRDNGRGSPKNFTQHRGMGINNMEYRAKMLGGQLSLIHLPKKGTEVRCILPIESVWAREDYESKDRSR